MGKEKFMQTFYTLSNAAGLIRSNKFLDKADAICVASTRAEQLNLPVKIYEHKEHPANHEVILVCNPDGSVNKPEGAFYEMVENDHDSGVKNFDKASVLLSSYETAPVRTFYLKNELSENLLSQLEKEVGVPLGLHDSQTFHAYTEDAAKVKDLETKLAEASIEVDRVTESVFKKHRSQAVLAARKAQLKARAARLPELTCRVSSKLGGGLKFNAHCELLEGEGKKAPIIAVYVNGKKEAEVKSPQEAQQIIADAAEDAFSKFLKKEF